MESVKALVEQLGSDDGVKRYQARLALKQLAWRAGNEASETDRAKIAAELAEAYAAAPAKPGWYYPGARDETAELLSLAGGEAEVPALKQGLADAESREMARWALERIQSPAATAALIEAAKNESSVEFRVGAIGSLSRIGGEDAIAALKDLATNAEPEIAVAALEGLACQADATSDKLFEGALAQGTDDRAKTRLVKARIRLADHLAKSGNKDAAKAIYQAVETTAEGAQKNAAARALVEAG
jgi:HEAT repeat protein